MKLLFRRESVQRRWVEKTLPLPGGIVGERNTKKAGRGGG